MRIRNAWALEIYLAAAGALFLPTLAHAQAADPTGAPPPEAEALVSVPAASASAPQQEEGLDGTTVALSAGGMMMTGNSRQVAATANGSIETRFGANGIGFSLLGNYARGAAEGEDSETTAENAQGRLRYDRYLIDRLSLFLINTGRRDRFQGLDFRYNLDPGVKYVFVQQPSTSFWGELGYDFQYDIRRDEARVVLDADGNPVIGPSGEPELVDKTATDHSSRVFVGLSHAFNPEVTFSSGLEYLQSFVETERARLNFDALLAAQLGAGLALGLGFSARYDHAPLPGKKELDTTTTVSLIYAFSNVAEPEPAPAPPPCPKCPELVAAPPPAPTEVAPTPVPAEPAPAEPAPSPSPEAPPPADGVAPAP